MTMIKARGIQVKAPRLAVDSMTMGQRTQSQAARGIGNYAKMEQDREGMNEEIRASNKSGLARLGSAVGGVAGGVFGGPIGAMVGSAAGGLLGGMM